MRVMIVDDERPCLDELEYLLKKHKDITIVGAYTNPLDALSSVQYSMPEALFIDIDMPNLSGIEFTRRIYGYDATVQVVFVTAHTRLLNQATKNWPFESILKPVSETKLNIIIERLRRRLQHSPDNSSF